MDSTWQFEVNFVESWFHLLHTVTPSTSVSKSQHMFIQTTPSDCFTRVVIRTQAEFKISSMGRCYFNNDFNYISWLVSPSDYSSRELPSCFVFSFAVVRIPTNATLSAVFLPLCLKCGQKSNIFIWSARIIFKMGEENNTCNYIMINVITLWSMQLHYSQCNYIINQCNYIKLTHNGFY